MLRNILSSIKKAWVVIGGMGIILSLLAWIRGGFNISYEINESYVIAIVFFILTIFSAIGACRQQRWGKVSLTILLLLLVLYCILFLGFMASGTITTIAGKIMFMGVCGLLIFAIVSIPAVWIKEHIK